MFSVEIVDTTYHPIRIHSAMHTLYDALNINIRLILNLETVQYKYVYTPIHECVVFFVDTSYHLICIHSATYTLSALNIQFILTLVTVQYKYDYTPIHECVVL